MAEHNIKNLDARAMATATAHIVNMLQRPGQLEKVQQYKHRLARKKASVEALLKSAMQQQLDGVKVGLNQLGSCYQEVVTSKQSIKTMFSFFSGVPALCNTLNDVREENMRHSQYVTAKENLKHIFSVPDSVEKTKQWINEGKLLHTHQCLRDLENSRDDLLYELHKLPNQSPHDKSMLKACFSDVEVLSTLLEKQLRFILSRTLNTVRKEPTVIVTALRIVEREEKSDELALKQEKQTGFSPPGRPKQWKKMTFEILEQTVQSRIEGTQVDEREDNKHWLIRYLELIRQMMLEDLRVVKTLCVPCFPPKYNIIDRYINMYHESLSKHLQQIIQNGLQGNEYVTILSWLMKTYKAPELLGHPDLVEHTANLSPLLMQSVVDKLESEYLTNIESNYTEWMQNALRSEKEEWHSSSEPHVESYSRTAAPIVIFQMIDQNLQVAKTISDDMLAKMILLSIEQLIKYADSFRTGIIEFKNTYFKDRKQVPFFTQYMIVIVNNCHQLVHLGTKLEEQYTPNIPQRNLSEAFNRLRSTYISLRNEAAEYLLEEPFIDMEQHFEKLFTQPWLTTTHFIDIIFFTLEDYFQDYNHLEGPNFKYVAEQARYMVVKKYLTALLSKRMSVKEDFGKVAEKILGEANKLKKLFDKLCPNVGDEEPFEAIIMLAEVIKSDYDMLSFELHRVMKKYPDISEDHLLRLLSLRGDLSKSDIKDKIAHIDKPPVSYKSSIFKTIVFPKLVNLNISF